VPWCDDDDRTGDDHHMARYHILDHHAGTNLDPCRYVNLDDIDGPIDDDDGTNFVHVFTDDEYRALLEHVIDATVDHARNIDFNKLRARIHVNAADADYDAIINIATNWWRRAGAGDRLAGDADTAGGHRAGHGSSS
jgi:hypothetical protein